MTKELQVVPVLTPHIKNVDVFLSHCNRRQYSPKSTLIHAGDKSDRLFYIVKGSVSVIVEDDDGI